MTKEQKERLDKAMSRWKYMGHCFDREEMGLAVTLIDEQAAENQRLRLHFEALEWYAQRVGWNEGHKTGRAVYEIARAALEGKDE